MLHSFISNSSMKNFLKIFIYFFIPIVIASACLEVYMRHIPNSYRYKDEWMKKNGNYVESLILGSSHAYYGINPEYLSGKAFNLANVSQDLERDYFVFNKYKDNVKNLKTVILVLSDANMLSTMEKGVESWRIAYYGIYMGYPQKRLALEITNARMTDKLQASLKGDDMLGCTPLGFGTAYKDENKQPITETSINEALERNTILNKVGNIDTTYLRQNIKALDEIILLCKQKNAKLIILTAPVVREYGKRMNRSQSALFYKIIHKKIKGNSNIEFRDYIKDPRFSSADFFDCDHLTNLGAKKFSEIISQEIH